jgi:hypothetical protein
MRMRPLHAGNRPRLEVGYCRTRALQSIGKPMMENSVRLTLASPATYRIRVQGRLDSTWSALFGDMALSYQGASGLTPLTILTGRVLDQAALFGLLNRLYGLGLPLVSVQLLSPALPDDE